MKCELCDMCEEEIFDEKTASGKYNVVMRKTKCEDCGKSIEYPTLRRKPARARRK